MKNTLKWLRDYGIVLLVFFLMINLVQNCNQSKAISKNTKAIAVSTARVDSINGITAEEFAIMLEIQRIQTAKLVLYDWNTVVRTVVRPDDRMNEYDKEIAKLNKELETIRQNKIVKKK
jgi:hypothetical protein